MPELIFLLLEPLKNALNIFLISLFGIPIPSSFMLISSSSFWVLSEITLLNLIDIEPFGDENFKALSIKL